MHILQHQGAWPRMEVLESSETIELTEQEKQEALQKALAIKQGRINEQRYLARIRQESTPPVLSAEQLLSAILAMASDMVDKFALTADQQEIYQMLAEYFTADKAFETRGDGFSLRKGLLLFGGVGCGKTTMMRLFSQNPRASYVTKSCRWIASQYADQGEEVIFHYSGQYFADMVVNVFRTKNWGICFDDLGTEEVKKHFGNSENVMEKIILNRYDRISEIPYRTHLTTNLSAEQIDELYGSRVRIRMREMFNTIHVTGTDMRK